MSQLTIVSENLFRCAVLANRKGFLVGVIFSRPRLNRQLANQRASCPGVDFSLVFGRRPVGVDRIRDDLLQIDPAVSGSVSVPVRTIASTILLAIKLFRGFSVRAHTQRDSLTYFPSKSRVSKFVWFFNFKFRQEKGACERAPNYAQYLETMQPKGCPMLEHLHRA